MLSVTILTQLKKNKKIVKNKFFGTIIVLYR
jgi:hypothetical protein